LPFFSAPEKAGVKIVPKKSPGHKGVAEYNLSKGGCRIQFLLKRKKWRFRVGVREIFSLGVRRMSAKVTECARFERRVSNFSRKDVVY